MQIWLVIVSLSKSSDVRYNQTGEGEIRRPREHKKLTAQVEGASWALTEPQMERSKIARTWKETMVDD
jgi:hypothetical protein